MKKAFLYLWILPFLVFNSCKKKDGTGFNLFTIEDDKKLGAQVAAEINGNPAEYPVLDQYVYWDAYQHLQRITDNILNSGEVTHKDDFAWEVKIIHDDNVLNAFCTPGGYIYVYTGIIKYLDTEDELAGVMGHEIAHADKRHSTEAMTKQYGISLLLDVVAGQGESTVKQIAAGLANLSYSRANETEADKYSVNYLSKTEYQCDGVKYFFEKITASGQSSGPAFLSTHPNPENRVQDINAEVSRINCSTKQSDNVTNYQNFKNSLP